LQVATWRIPQSDAGQLELLNRLSSQEQPLENLKELLDLEKLYYLATCQRVVMAFSVTEPALTDESIRDRLAAELKIPAEGLNLPEVFKGEAAFTHLCEVASSLDALVPGEPQVLGQFKEAFKACKKAGVIGNDLERWITRVLRVAKRVRTKTDLFSGSVSLIPLTTRFLKEAIEEARCGCGQVAVVGTGPIGQALLAKLAQDRELQIYCVSGDLERAREMVQSVDERAIPLTLEDFLNQPPCLEAVALATRSEAPFFGVDHIQRIIDQRCPDYPGGDGLRVLDLAMPRNADPAIRDMESCRLVQMDDLVELSEQSKRSRQEALDHARQVLTQELMSLRRERWKATHQERIMGLRGALEEAAKERLGSYPGDPDQDPRLKRWMEQTLNNLIHVAQSTLLDTLERAEKAHRTHHVNRAMAAMMGGGPPAGHPGHPGHPGQGDQQSHPGHPGHMVHPGASPPTEQAVHGVPPGHPHHMGHPHSIHQEPPPSEGDNEGSPKDGEAKTQ